MTIKCYSSHPHEIEDPKDQTKLSPESGNENNDSIDQKIQKDRVSPESGNENNNVDQKIQKSLSYSIWDGTFYSIHLGFGHSFFSPYALFLKAQNMDLALLGSLPQVIGSFLQLFSNNLLNWLPSRQRLVCMAVFLQALMFFPIGLAFFLGPWKVPLLILFVCLHSIAGMIIGPIWNGWMGDLVPEDGRGAYFSKRNRIMELAFLSSMLVGGYLLNQFKNGKTVWGNIPLEYIGFALLFILAFSGRMISFYFLTQKYEPEYKPTEKSRLGFALFCKSLTSSNYGTYVMYLCFLNFAIFLATPFFTPYILKDLKLDYMMLTIINATAVIAKVLFLGRWGKLCDQYGSKKVMMLTGCMICACPIFWLFSENIFYLLLIQIYAGAVWAGFEIACLSFSFENTNREERVAFIAYYNVLNGISIFFGGIAGGLIVKYHYLFSSPYLLVFLISGLLRFLVFGKFVPHLVETRKVEEISYIGLICQLFCKQNYRNQETVVSRS